MTFCRRISLIHLWSLQLGCYASIFLALTACKKQDSPREAKESGPVLAVRTAAVEMRPMPRVINASGSFNAQERSTLSVKVPGRLERITVDIGSAVTKGDLLAQVEREDYELRVRQAEGALAQARARLGIEGEADQVDVAQTPVVRQAKAVLDEASKNRDRIRELTTQKILSQSELDTAESAYTVALGKYHDALQDIRERQALVLQRRAELEFSRKQLQDSTIHSPFDGIVQQRRASLGEFLSVGTPLLVVAAVNPLRLQLEVAERQSTQVGLGQAIRVRVGSSTNVYLTQIARVSPMLSASNRMLVVEADVPASPELRPGLFAEAAIVVNEAEPALSVPESAVTSFVGLEKVFLLKEGKALEQSVATGRRHQGQVEVLSGVKPGDRVILDPTRLRSGQRVEEAHAKAD